MKTIKAHILITTDGQVILSPAPDLKPGNYEAVIVLQPAQRKGERNALELPIDDLGAWHETVSLRREDIYGDDGR